MSENENKVETCATCRVRESEKAGFGGRRPVLWNRSPLRRREGAAVRPVSRSRDPRTYVEPTVLRGPVLLQGCSGYGWDKEFWRSARGWTGWELGVISIKVHFLSLGESVLCFA